MELVIYLMQIKYEMSSIRDEQTVSQVCQSFIFILFQLFEHLR